MAGKPTGTKEDFIEKARIRHGEKYSYGSVVYVKRSTKVEIVCNSGHRNFWQTPTNHLVRGAGCPACSGNERPTTEAFVKHCTEKYSGKYTYDRAVYVDSKTELTITCSTHGDFNTLPRQHRNGLGCLSCGDSVRPTTVTYVAECKLRHNEKYSYDDCVYVDAKTKIFVTCRLHGNFSLIPSDHRYGGGCPRCTSSGYRGNKQGHFYILSDGEVTKVGITNRAVNSRVLRIRRSSGLDFEKKLDLCFENGELARTLEKISLSYLRKTYKQVADTFDGSTETFVSIDFNQLLMFIKEQVSILTDATQVLDTENKLTYLESEKTYV